VIEDEWQNLHPLPDAFTYGITITPQLKRFIYGFGGADTKGHTQINRERIVKIDVLNLTKSW